jgi:hypothetical protein
MTGRLEVFALLKPAFLAAAGAEMPKPSDLGESAPPSRLI